MKVKPVIRKSFGSVDYQRNVQKSVLSMDEKQANSAMHTYYKCKSSLIYAENNGHVVLDGKRVDREHVASMMVEQVPIIDAHLSKIGQPTLLEMQADVNRRVGIGMNDTIRNAARKFEQPGDDSYSYLNRYSGAPIRSAADVCRGGSSKITMPEMLKTQMMYAAVLKESQHTLAGMPLCVIDRHRLEPHEMDKVMAKQLACLEIGENQHGIGQIREPGSDKRQIAYMPGGRCANPVNYEILGVSMSDVKSKNMNRKLPSVADDFSGNQKQGSYGDFIK